jgi:hypothetical protein
MLSAFLLVKAKGCLNGLSTDQQEISFTCQRNFREESA